MLSLVVATAVAGSVLAAGAGDSDDPGDAVVLLRKKTRKLLEHGDSICETRMRVKILTHDGAEEYSVLRVPYVEGKEEVTLREGSVISPDGAGTREITDVLHVGQPEVAGYELYGRLRYMLVFFPGLTPGAVLEYTVRVREENFWSETDRWSDEMEFQTSDPVAEACYELSMPRGTKFQVKLYHAECEPEVFKPKMITYRWTLKDFPPLRHRSGDPPRDGRVAKIVVGNQRGWEHLCSGARDAFALQFLETSPALAEKAKGLCEGVTTRSGKIRRVYEFVARDVRTVELGVSPATLTPHFPAEVLEHGYGDEADKAELLAAMLRAVDIPAYVALVAARDSGTLDMGFATFSQFSNTLTYVPGPESEAGGGEGEDLFLDATRWLRPLGHLPPEQQRCRAFVIREDKCEFVQTTETAFADNRVDRSSLVTIQNHDFVLVEEVELRGAPAGIVRELLFDRDPWVREAYLRRMLRRTNPAIEVTSVKYSNPEQPEDPFVLQAECRSPCRAYSNDQMRAVRLVGDCWLSRFFPGAVSEERSECFEIPFPVEYTHVTRIAVPVGWEVVATVRDTTIDSWVGSLGTRSTNGGETFTLEHHLVVKETSIPPHRYADYREMVARFSECCALPLVLAAE